MRKNRNNFGFSLTEVLLALGTLSIGMIFVAGVFPVAIYFSTQASEQTIAAVVADEAIAKIRLFAVGDPIDPTDDLDFTQLIFNGLTNFEDAFPPGVTIDPGEFAYPSDPCNNILRTRYCWSALLRRVSPVGSEGPAPPGRLVQVTIFVCRKTSPSQVYRTSDGDDDSYLPVPVRVDVSSAGGAELTINDPDRKTFINDGYTIMDDLTGRLYRVLERDRSQPDRIILDRPWQGSGWVWVIPPPRGGGRYPCIAVYQKLIRF
jgi:type II secretory pathway pseudopilin PulG